MSSPPFPPFQLGDDPSNLAVSEHYRVIYHDLSIQTHTVLYIKYHPYTYSYTLHIHCIPSTPSKVRQVHPGTHVMINGQRWHMHYRITSTSDTIQGHATIEDLGLGKPSPTFPAENWGIFDFMGGWRLKIQYLSQMVTRVHQIWRKWRKYLGTSM